MKIKAFNCSDACKKLLDSAEELFAAYGYELTSIRQIAGNAGMNISLISYYFGSKQALYRKIFQTRLNEMTLRLQSVTWYSLPAAEKLKKFLTVCTETYRSHGNFQRMLYREFLLLAQSQNRDVIENYHQQNRKIFTEIMQEGVANGEFRPLDAGLFYMTLISMMSVMSCDTPVAGRQSGQSFTIEEIKAYLSQLLLINSNTANYMN